MDEQCQFCHDIGTVTDPIIDLRCGCSARIHAGCACRWYADKIRVICVGSAFKKNWDVFYEADCCICEKRISEKFCSAVINTSIALSRKHGGRGVPQLSDILDEMCTIVRLFYSSKIILPIQKHEPEFVPDFTRGYKHVGCVTRVLFVLYHASQLMWMMYSCGASCIVFHLLATGDTVYTDWLERNRVVSEAYCVVCGLSIIMLIVAVYMFMV